MTVPFPGRQNVLENKLFLALTYTQPNFFETEEVQKYFCDQPVGFRTLAFS